MKPLLTNSTRLSIKVGILAIWLLIPSLMLAAAPKITTLDPSNNATNVGVDGSYTITFDQNIEAGYPNKKLNVIDVLTEDILFSYSITSNTILVSGNTLTFTPPEGVLEYNASYYLNLQAGAVKNASGEYFTGMAYIHWEVSTGPDTDEPVEVSKLPIDGAFDILEGVDGALRTALYMVFNESIQAGAGNILIKRSSDDATAVSLDMSLSSSYFIAENYPNVLNLKTDVALDTETEYYVIVPTGAILDEVGNTFAGFSEGEWTFTTREFTDTTNPQVVMKSPADNTTNIELETNLSLTFNEAVQVGTGNVQVKQFSDDSQVFSISIGTATISDNVVTVPLPSTLSASTEYYIEMASGVLEDLFGNPFAGVSKPDWSFTTSSGADVMAPLDISNSPVHEAIQVWTYEDIQINFNEPVQKGIGTIYIKEENSDLVVHAINVASPEVSTDYFQRVDVNLPPGLEQNKEYYVEIASGVIQDLAGNNFQGYAKGDWTFKTTDTEMPEMVSLSPVDGSVDVATDETFTLVLNEPIEKHSSGSIRIKRTADNITMHTYFVQTSDVTVNENLVSFTLPGSGVLSEGTEYYIEINYGASNGLKDAAGNFFEGIDDHEWNFRTYSSDETSPTISLLSPVDDATDVATNTTFEIEFNEPIKKTSGNISFYHAGSGNLFRTISIASSEVNIDGSTMSITPYTAFQTNSSYYIQMGGVVSDMVDNTFAGISGADWSFTTVDPGDITAPVVTGFNPLDDATDVPIGNGLTLFFDEDVQLSGDGYIRFRRMSDNYTLMTVEGTSDEIQVAGNSLNIITDEGLPSDTELYVEMLGVVTDLTGNYFGGFGYEDYSWSFTTSPDVTPPNLLSTNPVFNEMDVAVDGIFTIEFDETVYKGAGLPLFTAIDDQFVDLLIGTEIVVNENVVTIDPDISLVGGTQYYIKVGSTAFRDVHNNYYEGIDGEAWYFTTVGEEDETAPGIHTLSPANHAMNVSESTNLTITFNEHINRGTGYLSVKESATNNLIAYINIQSANISGATVTFTLPVSLESNASAYYVELDDGAITDLAGNSYNGFTGDGTWQFTTLDDQDPFVISKNPSDGADEVANSGAQLELQFNESIMEGSGAVFIKSYEDDQIVEEFAMGITSNYTISGNTLTLSPDNTLAANEHYYIWISSTAIDDASGNTFGGITDKDDWDFTTFGEDVPPAISTLSPPDNASNVSVDDDLVITFDESVQFSGSGFARVKFSSGATRETINLSSANATFSGNTLTLNPVNDLVYASDFYVTISEDAIEDEAGNSFEGIDTDDVWNFTTEDVPDLNAPVVTLLEPYSGQEYVSVDADLTLLFNEDIQKGSGDINIREMSSDLLVQAIDVADASVSGNSITIDPPSDLDNLTEYYIEIASGVIEDLSGNAYAGIAKPDWSFTTIVLSDVTSPSVVSLDPVDGATDLSANFNLTITFDEPIKKGSGFIQIYDSSDDLIENINSAFSTYVTFSEYEIMINPPNDLPYNTEFYLNIPIGVITDLSNNSFTMGEGDWAFSTATSDVHSPNLIEMQPEDGEADVSLTNLNVFMTFDENVQAGSGNVHVRRNSDDVAVITKSASSLFGSGVLKWFSTSGDLDYGTEYYIEIESTAIEDTNGNAYAGISKGEWHFTTEPDVTAPTAQILNPTNGAINVDILTSPSITFSEDIQTMNGTIFFKDVNSGEILDSYDINDSEVTIGSDYIVIDPVGNLLYEKNYTIEIGAGVVQDLSGNDFAGIFDGSWDFTTEDKLTQTITFSTISDKVFGDSDFSLSASSSVGLPITLEVMEGPVTLSGSTATITGAGEVTIRASQAGNDTYASATPVDRIFTIDKADQSITFGSIADREFGDDAFSISPTSSSGLDVSLTVVSGPAFLIDNQVVTTGTGTAVIAANQSGSGYYNAASEVQQSFDITKADQVITFTSMSDQTYGDEPFQLTASASSGLAIDYAVISGNASVSGDELSITGVGNITLEAAQEGDANYNAATPLEQSFTVGKATLTVTATDQVITYGDDIPSLDYEYEGFVNGEDASELISEPEINTSATNGSDAGSYEITLTGGVASNYEFDLLSGTLTIEKADQTITVTPIDDKLITAADFAVSASTSSGLTLTYTIQSGPASISGNTISLNGSSGTVTVEVSQSGNENYNAASSTVSFDVLDSSKEDQTITFPAISDQTYGGDTFELNATSDSGLPVFYNLISGPATISESTVTTTGAGEITIEAQQDGNDTYNAAEPVPQSFTVAKATLTVSADNRTITYGDEIPQLTYTYEGFVNGEGPNVLTSEPSISTAASAESDVGNYEIILEGGEADNYEVELANATLTIVKATQVITVETITDKEITDESFEISASTTSGLTLSYSIESGPATISGSVISLSGTSGIVTVQVSQNGDNNYHSAIETISFNVLDPNKQDQEITFEAVADKTYGDPSFELEASSDSGLPITYTIVSGPATLTNNSLTITGVGIIVIAASQEGDDNYNAAATVEMSITVNKAMLSVVAEDFTITYGDVIPQLTYAYSGFVNGEDENALTTEPSISTAANENSNAGEYVITLEGGEAGNYELNLTNGTLTIAKADQIITIQSIDDQFTTADPFDIVATVSSNLELTYEVDGVATLNETTITLSGTPGNVQVNVSQAGNHNFNSASETISFQVFEEVTCDLTLDATVITPLCNGDNNGSIEVSVTGGSEPYTFSWSNELSGSSVTDLVAGIYQVTATDDNGCVAIMDIEVSQPDAMIVTAEITNDEGNESGAIDVSVNGGVAPYSFDWSIGDTTEDIAQIGMGTYNLTITDGNGCQLNESYEVSGLTATPEDLDLIVYPNPVSDFLIIESPEISDELIIKLISSTGKTLIEERLSQIQEAYMLDLRRVGCGNYFLAISTEESQITKRIIVKHNRSR